MTTNTISTRRLTVLALLAAISTVLMYFELPIPFMPPFLKLDISAVPVMIGSFMFGPIAGVTIAGLKAVIHLFSTQTGGVGELADFLITGSFALTAGVIYHFYRSKAGARLAAICSIFVITIVGCVANWFILLPFYKNIMPIDAIIAACNAINPYVTDAAGYIWFGVLPFNLLKGSVVCLLTFVLYKRLSTVIHHYTELDKKRKVQ
ncbi:MAG: ECF transporter S component [Ruthenibacterium sp.]